MGVFSRGSIGGLAAFIARNHGGKDIAELLDGMLDEAKKLPPAAKVNIIRHTEKLRSSLLKIMSPEKLDEYGRHYLALAQGEILPALEEAREVEYELEVDRLFDGIYEEYLT